MLGIVVAWWRVWWLATTVWWAFWQCMSEKSANIVSRTNEQKNIYKLVSTIFENKFLKMCKILRTLVHMKKRKKERKKDALTCDQLMRI